MGRQKAIYPLVVYLLGKVLLPEARAVTETRNWSLVRTLNSRFPTWTNTSPFLLSVTIPKGAMPGQTIAIMASGGTRRVKATVPAGLKPGDTFLVRLATPINPEPAAAVSTTVSDVHPHIHHATMTTMSPHFGPALDNWLTPVAPQEKKNPDWANSAPQAADKLEDHHQHRDPPSYAARGFISGREAPPAHDYYHQFASEQSETKPKEIEVHDQPRHVIHYEPQPPRQKFLLVHVPPGMPPGMILQVEIPGEGRTVAAQVPPGVQAFHVVYTPQQHPITPRQSPAHPPAPVVTPPKATTDHQPSQERSQRPQDVPPGQSSKPKRKLLLVRVPPDTAQGTTLHVSIPDEPGRILAAVVPPGNVTEFHVSYEPRAPKSQHDVPKVQYYGDKPTVVGTKAGERAYEQYNNTY